MVFSFDEVLQRASFFAIDQVRNERSRDTVPLLFFKVATPNVLGNRNLTLKAIFELLEGITGRQAPRTKIPRWLALGAGYFDQFVEGQLLGREPRIPLEGLSAAKKPMYVSCEKAVHELGLPQSSVEQALAEAVAWFENHGYN